MKERFVKKLVGLLYVPPSHKTLGGASMNLNSLLTN